MLRNAAFGLMGLLCLAFTTLYAQSGDSLYGSVKSVPAGFLSNAQSKVSGIDHELTDQSDKYLQRMASREEKMRQKLYKVDSNAGKSLFAGSAKEYASLSQKIKNDTGIARMPVKGVYQPYVDSLQGALAFMKRNPQLFNQASNPQFQTKLQQTMSQYQGLEAKMQDASQVKAFLLQRKQQIGQYLTEHENLQGVLGKQYSAMNQDVYYYSQRVRQLRESFNDPDKMEREALTILSKMPAFQTFMKSNSQLSGLFGLPGGGSGSAAQALAGLQTKDQISQQVQGQVMSGGQTGMDNVSSSVESAQTQLNSYKSKLPELGAGSSAADVPDFRPNDQKTKKLWNRLEYGANIQTVSGSYYFPVTTDLGLSLAYKLGHSNDVGIGASYKVGWGTGIQHINFSSQGVGVRSFVDIGIKNGLALTGGLEYNYTTPINSVQELRRFDLWTKSGLLGLSKTISTKSRLLKKTKLQLLWDFLSYQQVPKTQPILFRIGYVF